MHRHFLPLALIPLFAAGCSDRSEQQEAPQNATPPQQMGNAISASAPASPPPAIPTKAGRVMRNDAALDFAYKWPTQAASISALDAWLRSHAETQYREAHTAAMRDSAAMKADGFPFRKHALEQTWSTVADTPQTLVLEAQGYAYTGGAHGMPFHSSIIWDKAQEKRIGIGQFFDLPRFSRLVTMEYCDILNRHRREKRGIVVRPDSDDPFSGCPDILKQQIIPVSLRGKGLDTVRIIIGPYEAGPYAEGTYTIEMQVDGEMMRVVRPPYNGWFAAP